MRLYQINNSGNQYCGPAVISALAGIGTKEAAAIIRVRYGQTSVRGTHASHVQYALSQLGFGMLLMPQEKGRQTLVQWAKAHAKGKEVWLLEAGKHWVLVQGRYAMCGKTIDMVLVRDHPNANSVVKGVYRIRQDRKIDPQSVIPAKSQFEITEAAAKRKAKRLAALHGVELEREREDLSIWIYPPAGVQPVDDPFEEHFVDYWKDALVRVEKYIEVAKMVATRPEKKGLLMQLIREQIATD